MRVHLAAPAITVAALLCGLVIGLGIGPHHRTADALTVIVCTADSSGGALSYQSEMLCPIVATVSDGSALNQWDTILLAYGVIQSTFSGCSSCQYDVAFDSNNGGSGRYYVEGTHTAYAVGYNEAFGTSFSPEFLVP